MCTCMCQCCTDMYVCTYSWGEGNSMCPCTVYAPVFH